MKNRRKYVAFVAVMAAFGFGAFASGVAYADEPCLPCIAPGQVNCYSQVDGTMQNVDFTAENAFCTPPDPDTFQPTTDPVEPIDPGEDQGDPENGGSQEDPGNGGGQGDPGNGGGTTEPGNGGNGGGGNGGGTSSCPAGTSARECAKSGLNKVTNEGDETELTNVVTTVLSAAFFVLGIVAVIIIIRGGFW